MVAFFHFILWVCCWLSLISSEVTCFHFVCLISPSTGLDSSITRNDVESSVLEVFVDLSVDVSWSRLFMSYFVGSFQSIGVCQELSRLSRVFFLHFGLSTWGSLSSPVLVKLYCPCLFMLILYHLQLIPIWLVPCIPLSSANGSFSWCSEFLSVLSFCQGLQKLFDGICSCCCCEKFLIAFCCPLISLFWCCFQYYILPLIGTFVMVHHSHNYPYHKGCCWHCQLWYPSDLRRVQVVEKKLLITFSL